MTAPPPPPLPRRPRGSRSTATTVGLVAASVLGVALLVAAAWVLSRPVTYGWFAYAPESDTTFTPSGAPWHGRSAVLAAGGALLLGLVGGFVLGRRTGPALRGPAGDAGAPTPDDASSGDA
ncbi:hypothetical protein V5D56_06130 [Cellulosimicrobium sp. PMB13]|uniref:hypothetical protein n=1 Tax=Cellulosimicrobium sp. PMB13 TaxID=3120158 RepID=UPI003F4BD985